MKCHGTTKAIAVSLFFIMALWLVSTLLFGVSVAISFVLLLLIKVLFAVFIIGLVVSLVLGLKKNIFTNEDIELIKDTFRGKKTAGTKETCIACSRELQTNWNVCPYCSKEKEVKQEEV